MGGGGGVLGADQSVPLGMSNISSGTKRFILRLIITYVIF